jgi:hypothetical protein
MQEEFLNTSEKPASWFSRKILRRTSSTHSVKVKLERHLKHKRSISDFSLRLKIRRDPLKDKDLQELVRLCGLSLLYLPTEYAAGSLALPTCFRATAQYLSQHGKSRVEALRYLLKISSTQGEGRFSNTGFPQHHQRIIQPLLQYE